MKNFVKLTKNEMKMVVGGYIWTGNCLTKTTTNLGSSESYCYCAIREDGSFYIGECTNLDNMA